MVSGRDRILMAKKGTRLKVLLDDQLKQLIVVVLTLLGIPEEKYPHINTLIAFIRSEYGSFTKEEFELAFTFAITGAYNSENKRTNIDLSLYDKLFSAEYVGRIMGHYINYSRQMIHQVPQHKEEEVVPKKISRKWAFEALENHIQTTRRIPIFWPFAEAYAYSVGAKIIIDSEDFRATFRERVKREMEIESRVEERGKVVNNAQPAFKSDEELFQYECKKRRIIEYFRTKYSL